MENDFFYSSYVPKNVYFDIVNDIKELESDKDTSLNEYEKMLVFWSCRNAINNNLTNSDILEAFFGKKFNYELMKLEDIVNSIFTHAFTTDSIMKILNNYDNTFFWDAFGLSTERGDEFVRELKSNNDKTKVFELLKFEIINLKNANKGLIFNTVVPLIYQNCLHKEAEDNISVVYYYRIVKRILNKYPKIVSRIFEIEDYPMSLNSIISLQSSVDFINNESYNPQLVCDILYPFKLMANEDSILYIFNYNLNLDETNRERMTYVDTFKYNKYGYEVYNYYLDFCERMKLNPGFSVVKPEEFFMNSYKVPQLNSLYHRYYPTIHEIEAKQRTFDCYSELFDKLKSNKYLDEDCDLNEFLWAFGLTDEYPFAFRKIKFYTLTGKSKKDKGNGAFLCLLTILGYTSEEIKAMLHRNPENSIINKTFDLTMKDNTIMSKDYDALLKIVKSSGLPI